MKWDLETLKSKASIISGRIKTSKDPEKTKYLVQELILIYSMISYLCSNDLDEKKYVTAWNVSDKEYHEKVGYLGANLGRITFRLDFLEYAEHLPVFLIVKKTIPEEDYIGLVEKFFSKFEFNLLATYNNIISNHTLHFSSRPFFDSTTLGITNYLPTFGLSYVQIAFGGEVDKITCLPHEIAHAYQFEGVDHARLEAMGYSVFREAFPHFVELSFIDFLKHTKYYKNAMNLERCFLESMSVIRELYGSEYMNTESITSADNLLYLNNHGEEIQMPDTCRFISKILACYFHDIYRTSTNGIKEIEDFNKMFRLGKEYDYVRLIPNERLIAAVKNEFNTFYQDRQSRKCFKINRNVK